LASATLQVCTLTVSSLSWNLNDSHYSHFGGEKKESMHSSAARKVHRSTQMQTKFQL
jgi:hypothetical protein